MNSSNKLWQTLLIISAIALLLIGLSFTDSSFQIGKYTFKRIDIFSDIKSKGVYLEAPLAERLLTDSIIKLDSTAQANYHSDPSSIVDYGTDTLHALSYFFESLLHTQHKIKKTRIGYFGDSMIEGDLITQDLRNNLQDTFGGIGVGFMPITSIVADFRQTVSHKFSSDWQTYSLFDQNESNHTLGITGFDFVPSISNFDTINLNSGSWVKYAAVSKKHLNSFYNVKLFYGESKSDNNFVIVGDRKLPLKGLGAVNQISLLKNHPVQSLQVTFQCKNRVNIFGFSMESDSGVYVDNFSFRGNSGMPLVKILNPILLGTNKHFDYGLIILHYGVNVVNAKVTDFSWYEKGMTQVVKHIQSAMPHASILIISTGDKSIRNEDGEYTTDPSVPLVIEVQKNVAQKTGVAFWNLYEAMGGSNSMVKWVEGDTILAAKDYTHLNYRGAKKVADLLYKHLMRGYKEYAKNK